MDENKLSLEFMLSLFDEKKEKLIVQYIFEGLNETEISEKLIKSDKEGKRK